ncbi:hypothetical protein [Bowmanella yangjiangensis]|uniref:Uncharacterized protein n=1 Tax=Bowmanella yangjiangensis TaxID=2811230 RepID=A0ABS3CTT0_9ALTE|nr:hypothetical protein [Bowmanella yangjiangensis]MBN7820528.1 hypothetical protein [Bowmanella yangjiangensis]
MILQPGEIQPFNLSGKYLICRRVEGHIVISNPDIGLPETRIKQADVVTLEAVRLIYVKNLDSAPVTLDLQSTTIPIASSDGGAVTISGGSIDSIRDAIQVTAQATVENGTMTSQSPNAVSDAIDISVAAGAKVQILGSTTKARRVVTLQNISTEPTTLRVGGATVAANRGAILRGSIDSIASAEVETVGAVYVHNTSLVAATVSVMWGDR